MSKFKPGSQAAIEAGCTCPIIDNHYGKGVPNGDGEPLYWYSGDCIYHKEPNHE